MGGKKACSSSLALTYLDIVEIYSGKLMNSPTFWELVQVHLIKKLAHTHLIRNCYVYQFINSNRNLNKIRIDVIFFHIAIVIK